MIMRDAQLSDRRLVLAIASGKPVDSVVAPVDRAVELEPIRHSNIPLSVDAILPHAPMPQVPKERELTFESVVAWLAVQDQETRESCAAILASEVTKIYETAKSEGFESGRKSGELAAQKEGKKLAGDLQKISVAAESAFAQEQEQLQTICVEVITEALGKIGGPLLNSEAAVIGAVKQVLTRVREGRELTIRVAREDFELIRRRDAELADVLNGRKYEIVADSRVELGGCLVETKLGSLDGRLEVQLRELYETLRLAKLTVREST